MQRSSLSLRWLVLLLSSLLLAGSTYSFDVPSSLFPFLQEYFADSLSAAQYTLLHNVFYSVYSIPNVVMPLIGGVGRFPSVRGPRSYSRRHTPRQAPSWTSTALQSW